MKNKSCIWLRLLSIGIYYRLLAKFNFNHRCIEILKRHITWLEGLDNPKYRHSIALSNYHLATCYLNIGKLESAINYLLQTTYTYYDERDIELQKKAMELQTIVMNLLKNKNFVYA
jgi:hypothetical protein